VLNRILAITLVVAYPLLVHISLVFAIPQLMFIAPLVFLTGAFWYGLIARHLLAWTLFIASCAGILLAEYLGLTLYLLYLPPILLPLLLLVVFGRTLLRGREPLITAIGQTARGPLSATMCRYTRRLTQLWCLVFAIMVIWSAVLPWLKQPELWSWFTNVINYGIVGAIFVGEFALRKKLFANHDHPDFLEYLRIIARARTQQ